MVANFDPSGGYRFTVAIDGVNYAAFTEFRLPSLNVQTLDILEGGQNTYTHKMPVRVNVGPATLRHGITRDLTLLKWYLQVLKGDLENAYRQVTVVMYDVGRKPIVTWTFRNACPVKWSGPTLKSDDGGVAIEEIEFIHHGFEVE
jgi:phage tail-like protein